MSTALLSPGATFANDYRIIRQLSSGGMGVVYVAEQLSTARERALKIMLGDLLHSDDFKRRFEQEAKIGAQIESEHIVEVVGAGIDAATGFPWLAMELLQGEDLGAHLRTAGPLSVAAALDVLDQLAHGVGAAHKKQIVHRDLKPENLFLAQSRRAGGSFTLKILDFGIAKLLGQAMTSRTSAMGTPLWMAPEQTENGGAITPAADVWAMGLIAFRVLSGKIFWKSACDPESSSMMILREMVMEPIPPATERSAELEGAALPEGFDPWFQRCLEREPSLRFADATSMYEELKRVLTGARSSAVAAPRAASSAADGSSATIAAPAIASSTIAGAPIDASLWAGPDPAPSPTTATALASSPSTAGAPKSSLSVYAGASALVLAAAAAAGIIAFTREPSASSVVTPRRDLATDTAAATTPFPATTPPPSVSAATTVSVALTEPSPSASTAPSASAPARSTPAEVARLPGPRPAPAAPKTPDQNACASKAECKASAACKSPSSTSEGSCASKD